MNTKICFFIGHRDAPREIYPMLCDVIEEHIVSHGVKEFIVGHYGNFDAMSARAVINAKSKYPDITLTLLLPYHPSLRKTNLPTGFDSSLYPEELDGVPKRYAIVRANKSMIERADHLIAYVRHIASNAYNIVEYAEKRRGIHITKL